MAKIKRPGGGNGQNGGTGQGAGGDGGQGDGQGDDEEIDLDQLVNAAVTGHLGRKLPGILGPMIAKSIETAMAPLQPLLEQIQNGGGVGQGGGQGQGQGAAGAGQGGQGQGAAGAGQGGQQDPEIAKLRRQLEELQGKLKEQSTATLQQEAAAREARRDQALTEGLSKLGVDKNRMRGALAIARESSVWDPEVTNAAGVKVGGWVWRVQRNGYHEDLGLDGGLAEWGKSDEGKSYIAAQPGRGPGLGANGTQPQRRPGGQPPPAGDANAQRQATKDQAATQLFQQVAGMMGGSVEIGGNGS